MEGMFNPVSILLHILNALILLVALYFLLLRPVRRFMSARTESIEARFASVAAAEQEVEASRLALQEEVAEARKTAADTVVKGVAQAREQAQKVLEDANRDAAFIMKQASIDAESMHKAARDEIRNEVVDLAFALATKLLQREVTQQDHDQLVDEFLKKVV